MSEQTTSRSDENLRHEYSEVVQNIRHYSNLRFAIFTIFFAVMGGIGFVSFGGGQFEAHAALVARVAGFAVIILFWLYEERAGWRNDHFQRVAMNLERALSYTQYTTLPRTRWFPPKAGLVNRCFFFLITAAWLYAALSVPLGR